MPAERFNFSVFSFCTLWLCGLIKFTQNLTVGNFISYFKFNLSRYCWSPKFHRIMVYIFEKSWLSHFAWKRSEKNDDSKVGRLDFLSNRFTVYEWDWFIDAFLVPCWGQIPVYSQLKMSSFFGQNWTLAKVGHRCRYYWSTHQKSLRWKTVWKYGALRLWYLIRLSCLQHFQNPWVHFLNIASTSGVACSFELTVNFWPRNLKMVSCNNSHFLMHPTFFNH